MTAKERKEQKNLLQGMSLRSFAAEFSIFSCRIYSASSPKQKMHAKEHGGIGHAMRQDREAIAPEPRIGPAPEKRASGQYNQNQQQPRSMHQLEKHQQVIPRKQQILPAKAHCSRRRNTAPMNLFQHRMDNGKIGDEKPPGPSGQPVSEHPLRQDRLRSRKPRPHEINQWSGHGTDQHSRNH